MSMENNLNNFIEELIQEIEKELDESTTSGNVSGYSTPKAFSDNGSKDKKHKKKIATQLGMKLVGKVNEAKEEVTPKQLSKIQNDIKKINRKIKVYISKHPVTKGKLQIELGGDHPFGDGDDREVDKIDRVLKKHTGTVHTGTIFMESVNEGYGPFIKVKNLSDIIVLSKKKKNATFYVTDDNNSRIGTFYLKNGKFAKATTANPNYDFQRNKTNLKDRSDVIYKYKVDESVDEATRGQIRKAAKKGSYPVSLVVVKDGKVINQVLNIQTPQEVPAAFNVVKNYHKHKGAIVHIEDKTGKRLFSESESVNERINPKFYDARVQYIDPKSKKKFVGDVVRYDNGEYKVNLGKDGRFEKYILAKEKDLKIVSKSKKKTFESVNENEQYVAYATKGKKVIKTVRDSEYNDKLFSKFKKDMERKGLDVFIDLVKNRKVVRQVYRTNESVNEGKKIKRPVNRWLELKNDETLHPHKKMAMGLKELKYQLAETQKFFNWYNKIKTMNELDSSDYWKRTNKHIYKIKERLINIAKTIQEIEK